MRFLAHCCAAQYEPELFPGLIYRMHSPKIVLLIFVSGKIVLTGAKVRHIQKNVFFVVLTAGFYLDARGHLRGL